MKEVKNIDRSKWLTLLTIVAMATILGGIALTTVGADTSGGTNELTSLVADTESQSTIESIDSAESMHWEMMPRFGPRRGPHVGRRFGFLEVSEEFEANVLAIAEGDEDVQALIDDGYNVTGVRPIIKTVVDGDGNVVVKATDAIVMLEKEETGKAGVSVDIEEAKVTEIVVLTRTVIEKP